MTIQTLTRPSTILDLFVALPKPIQACSRDYGFDFDEEELARELIAPLRASLEDQPIPEVDADEFESRYTFFLS